MKNVLIGLLALVVLVACSGGSTAAIQGQWELISYGPPSGQTPAASDVDTTIEFDSEGRMTGNVGCNGFGGAYEVNRDMITFSPIESTLMFCEGAVGDQELAIFTTLTESTTFSIDGDTMTITSADGESSITLGRK